MLAEYEDILVAILMDQLLYENMDLVDKAFKLFNQLFSEKISLFNYLKNI